MSTAQCTTYSYYAIWDRYSAIAILALRFTKMPYQNNVSVIHLDITKQGMF